MLTDEWDISGSTQVKHLTVVVLRETDCLGDKSERESYFSLLGDKSDMSSSMRLSFPPQKSFFWGQDVLSKNLTQSQFLQKEANEIKSGPGLSLETNRRGWCMDAHGTVGVFQGQSQ